MKAGVIERLVIDASIALSWCFEDESSPLAERVLDLMASGTEAVVPSIWPYEVANAMLVGERRKRVTISQVASLLKRIGALRISVEQVRIDQAFGPILMLARREQLTEYDASYIELALREGLSLATLDKQLMNAATGAGVTLVRI